jgi:hypothetical protein
MRPSRGEVYCLSDPARKVTVERSRRRPGAAAGLRVRIALVAGRERQRSAAQETSTQVTPPAGHRPLPR